MLQVFSLCWGLLLGMQEPPPAEASTDPVASSSAEDRGKELLRKAARQQTNARELEVHTFFADMLIVDRRQTDQDAGLEVYFETRTEDGAQVDRIRTQLETAKGSIVMTFDGENTWRKLSGRPPERLSRHTESSRVDRQELEKRIRLCHTLTQVFSLRVMVDRLENIRLVGEDVPDLDAQGKPMKWSWVLHAMSKDLGQLLPDPELPSSPPDFPPDFPTSPDTPVKPEEPKRAEVRLYFDANHYLGRLDIRPAERPMSREGVPLEMKWESIYFLSQNVVSIEGAHGRLRARIPMMALVYDQPRGAGVQEIFRINIKRVELNPNLEPSLFRPILRGPRRP